MTLTDCQIFSMVAQLGTFAAAAERLRQSEDSVLSIAEAVGFETLSNFNQQFKKRYGVTPRDYRRGEEPEHTGE